MAKKRREVQKEMRGSHHRMSKKQSSKQKRKFRAKPVMIVLTLLIVGAMYLFHAQYIVPTRESKRPLSILLVGSDVSDFRDEYFMGTKPEKTDALMVMTFNPKTYTVDMTSIPRDTSIDYVCDTIKNKDGSNYDGGPYQDQINELYQVSGHNIGCLEDSIGGFLNLPIDYYVKVNMDELSKIIDSIGGVDIDVYAPDYYLSQENASLSQTYSWTDGEKVTMDGDETLTYARARHDSSKDYGRGIRQQQVIKAILTKVLSAGINLDLIDSLYSLVETDMPMKLIYEYYQYVMSLKTVANMLGGTESVEVDDLPDSVWLNLYDLANFDGTLTGTEKQRQAEVEKFIQFVQSDKVDTDALKKEIISNHQLYNSAYSSHYNVDYKQLYEVSNELRANLGLEKEDVTVPSLKYGDNYALGLMPDETTLAKEGLE